MAHGDQPLASYDARAIANYVLDVAEQLSLPIYATTLLKVVYFAHGWHLAKFQQPLVAQPFEAWKHGPVVRVVYDQVAQTNGAPITKRLRVFNAQTVGYEEPRPNLSPTSESLVRAVVAAYSVHHPFLLSEMTHEDGSPWIAAWHASLRGQSPGARIANEDIREYFLRQNAAELQ
jgi:uncharacterized phage-associated protein